MSLENPDQTSPEIHKKKKTIWQKMMFLLTLSIVITVFAIGGVSFWALDYFKSPGPLKTNTTIIIPEGSSLKSISKLLSKNNIIKYPEVFTVIVRVSKSGNRMKAGEYEFDKAIAPLQVFSKIAAGEIVTHQITLAEGLMSFQILEAINNIENMTGKVPSDIKEGELLPETYDYHNGDDRERLVNRMKKAMQKTLDEAWENRAENLPLKTKEEALVLASIVEKETGIANERKRVAAVFINRLRKGMRLQTDPTVIYAITKGEYVLERPLRLKDLEKPSPYNTYKNYGLPPSPIANPGKLAIEAALHPDDTNEYYFVADGTGGHKFSTTLKEHNWNVAEWRRINRKKRK